MRDPDTCVVCEDYTDRVVCRLCYDSAISEIQQLRKIISECASALGNGSACLPEASVEFMQMIPAEIAAEAQKHRETIEAQKTVIKKEYAEAGSETLNRDALLLKLAILQHENAILHARADGYESMTFTDGPVYRAGRSEGRADIAALLRKIIDPADTRHLNLDGLLDAVDEAMGVDQALIDAVCYYRNLSIVLGAKPEQMRGEQDRKLCEVGIDPNVDMQGMGMNFAEELRWLRTAWDEAEKFRELATFIQEHRESAVPGGALERIVELADKLTNVVFIETSKEDK